MEITATCHVHSDWSYDGSWKLEDLRDKFRRRGCRVLLMTEHDRGFSAMRWSEYRNACAKASSDEILVVPGMEYSDAENRVHVLVWGLVPFLGEGLPTLEMLKEVRAADGVAVLAHPSRREVWKTFETAWTDKLLGIEAWNRKYDGWAPGKAAPELLDSTRAVPFVGLDFHTDKQLFPLTMALEIDGEVTEASVLACLRACRCQARAFGLPLNESLVGSALPLLRGAEKSRRAAASIVKKSGILGSRRAPANKS